LHAADLLVNEKHSRVRELYLRGFGISHEVRRNVSSVPLETLDVFDFGLETLSLRHCDCAIRTEFVENS